MVRGNVRVRIDPHVHSEQSFDGKEPVELIMEQAADIGLDSVVITDHDEIQASVEAAELAEEYDLIGVPGIEVSTKAGHLLAIGVEEKIPKNQSLDKTVEKVRELGGAAVIPHPFQRTRHGIKKKKINKLDAIETYNSWIFTGYRNRRAKKFAEKRNIPGIASSDAHSIKSIGRAYTEIVFENEDSKKNIESQDIVDAIKEGSTQVYGRRAPIHKSAGHYTKAVGRKTAYNAKKLGMPAKKIKNIFKS